MTRQVNSRLAEASRIEVKLAASMAVVFNARRQNSELPAKASMASTVNAWIRNGAMVLLKVGASIN